MQNSSLDEIAIDSQDNYILFDELSRPGPVSGVKRMQQGSCNPEVLLTVDGNSSDVAVDANDFIYVTKSGPVELIRIDPSGNAEVLIVSSQFAFGKLAFGPGGPFGTELFAGRVFVDTGERDIVTLGRTGEIRTFAVTHSPIGGIAFSPAGDMYLVEAAVSAGRIFRILPVQELGACCHASGQCQNETTESECVSSGGSWLGPGSACEGDNNLDGVDDACAIPPIPAVSQWGFLVLSLLLLTGIKIKFGRRRGEQVAA